MAIRSSAPGPLKKPINLARRRDTLTLTVESMRGSNAAERPNTCAAISCSRIAEPGARIARFAKYRISLQSDSEPCRADLSITLSTSAVLTSRPEAPTPIAAIARSLALPRIHCKTKDERSARPEFLRTTTNQLRRLRFTELSEDDLTPLIVLNRTERAG